MIYAIQAGDGGPIKFGVATNPENRLRELQTGNAHKLKLLCAVEFAEDKEELIHYHLRVDRLSGEWFKPSIDAWNVVWALERSSIYTEDHELTNHIVDNDPEAGRWFSARLGWKVPCEEVTKKTLTGGKVSPPVVATPSDSGKEAVHVNEPVVDRIEPVRNAQHETAELSGSRKGVSLQLPATIKDSREMGSDRLNRPKFDRTAYQREYMRKKRAKK